MGKILVTGGAGYIGSHLVTELIGQGEQVVVLDNLSQGSVTALDPKATFIQGDITNPTDLFRVFAKNDIEVVCHLAALVNAAESGAKKAEYQQVNEQGSELVWQTARQHGVKICLYASSAAVYGTPKSRDPITEQITPAPTNVYGATKLAGEHSLTSTYPTGYGIFRFFNVGGADDSGLRGQSPSSRAIMPRLFEAATSSPPTSVTISGHDYDTLDGTVVRDFVHVMDIVRAFSLGISYLRQGKPGFILNLGGGHPTTILQVAQLVEDVSHVKIPLVYAPRVKGDIDYSLSSIDLAQKTLGWSPLYSIKDIISSGYQSYVVRTQK